MLSHKPYIYRARNIHWGHVEVRLSMNLDPPRYGVEAQCWRVSALPPLQPFPLFIIATTLLPYRDFMDIHRTTILLYWFS